MARTSHFPLALALTIAALASTGSIAWAAPGGDIEDPDAPAQGIDSLNAIPGGPTTLNRDTPAGLKTPPPLKSSRAASARSKAQQSANDFEESYRELEPLTPDQIRELGRRRVELERARSDRPAPQVSTQSVPASLRPGAPPPAIRLSDGYATAVTVLDRSGEAWPIMSATVGSSEDFKIELPKAPENILIVSPLHPFARSNLILLLKDASVPLTLSLTSGRDVSFYSATVLMDGLGPNARPSVVGAPIEQADNRLMRAILDGAGAVTDSVKMVEVNGGGEGTTGYFADGRFYLRTPYTVLSPAWEAVIRGGGIGVYQMPAPVPFISMTDDRGRPLTVTIPESAQLTGALSSRSITARP